MNTRTFLFLLFFSGLETWISPGLFAQFSLFSSSQKRDVSSEPSKLCPAPIQLYAIIYTDDQHWSLWINDQIITPENQHILKNLVIKKVTPERVTFSILSSGNREKNVTLSPLSP